MCVCVSVRGRGMITSLSYTAAIWFRRACACVCVCTTSVCGPKFLFPYYVALCVGPSSQRMEGRDMRTGRKSIRTVCVCMQACLYSACIFVVPPRTVHSHTLLVDILKWPLIPFDAHACRWASGPTLLGCGEGTWGRGRQWARNRRCVVRESTPICIRLHNNGGRLYPLGHIKVVVVVADVEDAAHRFDFNVRR